MAAFNFAFYILLFSRLFLYAFTFSVFFCLSLCAFSFSVFYFYLAFCAFCFLYRFCFASLSFLIYSASYLYRILFIRLSFIPHRHLQFSYPYFIYHEFTFFSLITDKTPLFFLRQKRIFAFVCSYRS